MKNKELYFVPFESLIIGADKEHVFIQEQNEDEHFILKINKNLYLKCCNEWLDAKTYYCIRYGHFCGQMGRVCVLKYKQSKTKINILIGFENSSVEEDDKEIYKKVNLYEVIEVDEICMEHG